MAFLQSYERIGGGLLLVAQLAAWAVSLAGTAQFTNKCIDAGVGDRDACSFKVSTPWTVFALQILATLIAFALVFVQQLRILKPALLSVYTLVTTLLAVICHFFTPIVHENQLAGTPLTTPAQLILGGSIALIIVNLLWILLFNGVTLVLNPTTEDVPDVSVNVSHTKAPLESKV